MTPIDRPVLFLDRDGVINRDSGYVHDIERFEWVPGIFDTVRFANELGLRVIVVTNQAGIARGLFTEQQFLRLTNWMVEQFANERAPIAAVYYCPYHPEGVAPYRMDSEFRKPAPGMLLQAASEHRIDLGRSLLIGDQETDIQAGRAAGLKSVARFHHDALSQTAADAVLASHAEARAWLSQMIMGTDNLRLSSMPRRTS